MLWYDRKLIKVSAEGYREVKTKHLNVSFHLVFIGLYQPRFLSWSRHHFNVNFGYN